MADAAPPPESPRETDDLWSQKPWWCQPWSIVGTGLALVGGSWCWLRLWWISLPLAAVVLVWWWLFLVLVPAAYAAQVSGSEPTGVQINRSADQKGKR
jgi:hypothetical protein